MGDEYYLREDLDRRLLAYAARSWNAYQAVHALQQYVALLPLFADDLRTTFGVGGPQDHRRAWGVAADLLSAMTGEPATRKTLLSFGYKEAAAITDIIPFGGDFELSNNAVVRDRSIPFGDPTLVDDVLRACVVHDRVARPLLESFRDEVRCYDMEITELRDKLAKNSAAQKSELQTFFRVFRSLESVPRAFPLWDGRPMFLDEQRALLDYIAKFIGAEIIANCLVDSRLGLYLLRGAHLVELSRKSGRLALSEIAHLGGIAEKSLPDACHLVGDTALTALTNFDDSISLFERFFVVEEALSRTCDIDISPAFEKAREEATSAELFSFFTAETTKEESTSTPAPFEYPEFPQSS